MQRLANALVDEAFATWEPNPSHRHAKLLERAPQAYAAIRRVATLQHPCSSDIGNTVGARELRNAARSVQRMLSTIQDRPPRAPQPAPRGVTFPQLGSARNRR